MLWFVLILLMLICAAFVGMALNAAINPVRYFLPSDVSEAVESMVLGTLPSLSWHLEPQWIRASLDSVSYEYCTSAKDVAFYLHAVMHDIMLKLIPSEDFNVEWERVLSITSLSSCRCK